MKTRDFSFDLPEDLIAQHPLPERGTSRLLVLNRTGDEFTHSDMNHIVDFIPPESTVVFNDSRVRKARVFSRSLHGGEVELLLVKRISADTWRVITSKTRKQRVGKKLLLPAGVTGEIIEKDDPFRIIRFSEDVDDTWLDVHGHVPLPPYIERPDEELDSERYQTVYSRLVGSVAAPTAGLHFTESILHRLAAKGISIRFITLHVGAGTFFPIRSERIEDHTMHEEEYEIDSQCADHLNSAREQGRRIIAVGTTSLRCIEAAAFRGDIEAGRDRTSIFIKPGYDFRVVNGLFTNFHTPESTLMVLVSAFAGVETIKKTYKAAVESRYRFFSYGDAMLIL